jgi:acetyltransferase-like isoleucine patch superfamily enzyme
VSIQPGATLIIGSDVCLRRFTTIEVMERVVIGNDTLIAEMVTIRDHEHKVIPGALYRRSGFTIAPVEIGKNVWLGNKVTVTSGTRIGDNAIIGANAVVTHDIPDNSIASFFRCAENSGCG